MTIIYLTLASFTVFLLLPQPASAGVEDTKSINNDISHLEQRAKGFKQLMKEKNDRSKYERDRLKHIQEREAYRLKQDRARLNYIEEYKKLKRDNSAAFQRHLAKEEREFKARRKNQRDYVSLLKKLKAAYKKYRQDVPELTEVDLPHDYE